MQQHATQDPADTRWQQDHWMDWASLLWYFQGNQARALTVTTPEPGGIMAVTSITLDSGWRLELRGFRHLPYTWDGFELLEATLHTDSIDIVWTEGEDEPCFAPMGEHSYALFVEALRETALRLELGNPRRPPSVLALAGGGASPGHGLGSEHRNGAGIDDLLLPTTCDPSGSLFSL